MADRDATGGCGDYSVIIEATYVGDGIVGIGKIHSYEGPHECRSEAVSQAVEQWVADMKGLGFQVG